jgi:hypothetical protein
VRNCSALATLLDDIHVASSEPVQQEGDLPCPRLSSAIFGNTGNLLLFSNQVQLVVRTYKELLANHSESHSEYDREEVMNRGTRVHGFNDGEHPDADVGRRMMRRSEESNDLRMRSHAGRNAVDEDKASLPVNSRRTHLESVGEGMSSGTILFTDTIIPSCAAFTICSVSHYAFVLRSQNMPKGG